MYNIAVKIEAIESRKRNAGLLHIILGLFLILKAFDYYNYILYASLLPIIPILIVAGLSLYYAFFRKTIYDGGRYNLWLRILQVSTFTIFGFAMLRVGRPIDYYGLFLWAVLSLILLISERKIFNDTVLYIKNEGIQIPGSLSEVMIPWSEMKTVVIRHDFITIFQEEPNYLQFQVMQTLSELEVAKMNAFCREKLEPVDLPEGLQGPE